MRFYLKSSFITVAIMLSLCCQAFAVSTTFYTARSLGMGGANIVSTNDAVGSQYYNPAALGFFNDADTSNDLNGVSEKVWGWDIAGVSGGWTIIEGLSDALDDIEALDYSSLSGLTFDTESDVITALELSNALSNLDEDLGVIANIGAMSSFRFSNFAVGIRFASQVGASVTEIDTSNIGVDSVDVNSDLEELTIEGDDGETSYLTTDQQTELSEAGLSDDAIQNLDYLIRTSDVTIDNQDEVIDLLADLVEQAIDGSGSIDDNTTTLTAKGLALVEVPISYGYKINDSISVGGSLKVMKGRVYGAEVFVFDDSAEDVLDDIEDDYQDTTTFGIDLSLMGRYGDFGFGLTGQNLNSPTFDGFSKTYTLSNGSESTMDIDDVTMDPQFTAGVAYFPTDTVTLEFNCDLTEQSTILSSYNTQYVRIGMEWDIYRMLALRLGGYTNFASDDSDPVITAGIGLNLWLARIDLAGAMSTSSIEYDGTDAPSEAQLALNVSMDF
jgi:hypothetical protein